MILEPEDSQHGGEPTYMNDFQRWVIGRLMKRLLNQISPKSTHSKVGQFKHLFTLINKMVACKSTYEKAINMRLQTHAETPKETSLRIMSFIAEFELRDKIFNKKLDSDEDFQNALA